VSRSPIRAVFFDVGGTLIHPWPSVGAVYAEVAARHGIATDAGKIERAFHESWRALKGTELTVSRKDWWRELVFRTLACTDEAYFEELYEVFARREAWRLYPDALDALREARRCGLHVGVISNWDSRLRPLLEAMGVGKMLDSMTISCEVGVEKPDARIFRAALATAHVQPHEALHVGDSHNEDVAGAVAVGMQALHVERKGGVGDGSLRRALSTSIGWS
jgi:putative hydrolase of the HAD superfamily